MISSDQRVLNLRKVIDQKETELGEAPKPNYKTNLKVDNINVLTLNLEQVVVLLSKFLMEDKMLTQAATLIGTDAPADTKNMVDDLVTRGKVLLYKKGKDELTVLRKQLDDLRSETLKREDHLDKLESLLKM